MITKYKHKLTGIIVEEICIALVQASRIMPVQYSEKMTLYRADNGDNWVRETKEFMEKFMYCHDRAGSYWTHKVKGGRYQVIADPIHCAATDLEDMDMVVCYQYEDKLYKMVMGQRQFIMEFEIHNPLEGQIRLVDDGADVFMGGEWRRAWRKIPKPVLTPEQCASLWDKASDVPKPAPIWYKAPHKMTIDGVEVVAGDKIALKVEDGVIVSRFSPFVPENVNINVDIKAPDVNGFKASQSQMARQVAAQMERARKRGHGYKYVSEHSIPMPNWSIKPGISTINGKTPEEFAKTDDIYKDVADKLYGTKQFNVSRQGNVFKVTANKAGHDDVVVTGDSLVDTVLSANLALTLSAKPV
jgi:hypothetical protein